MDQIRIKNKRILIDTNVLVYCGNKDYGQQAKKLLRILKDDGNSLATSEASCFELIKNALDEKLRNYYMSLINYIDDIPITTEVLMNGCILYHHYLSKIGDKSKKIESIDLIISGTIMYHQGALLLTCNRKHFPFEFWKNLDQEYIMYKEGESTKVIDVYLLEFNYEKIDKKSIEKVQPK